MNGTNGRSCFRQEVAFERIDKHLVNRVILIAWKYEKIMLLSTTNEY